MPMDTVAPNPQYSGLRIVNRDDLFPKGFTQESLGNVYYGLIQEPGHAELIAESAAFEDVDAFYNPGREVVGGDFILEAVTVEKFSRTEKRMLAVVRTFNKYLNDSEISALPPVVGKPRKSGSFAYVTVQLPFSDGQVISVIFHSPEGDKRRVAPDDTIIAFRWLLNKRDITHVVAPEEGKEVSVETIAKRLTQLVVKNSARFEKQQKTAIQESKALDEAREALHAAEDKQAGLMDDVAAAAKDTETWDARLSATLTALEKQRTYNAELEAKLAALRAQQRAAKEVETTAGRSETTPADKSASEPGNESTSAAPEYVQILQDMLTGKYDSDTGNYLALLEKAINDAEQAGTFAQYEKLLDDASNRLTDLLTKEAA